MEKTKLNIIRLYTVEEDEIYPDLRRAILKLKAPIELLGVLNSRDIGTLRQTLMDLSPDVVFININNIDVDIIKEVEQIRLDHPKIGIVLLFGSCTAQDIEQLRRLALLKGVGGTALFLKQPLNKMEWLCSAISAVSQGQFILDAILTAFMFTEKPETAFLERFTPRELDILNLLANGYKNLEIAATLHINIKTVEQHLNNLYSKLKTEYEFSDKHLRVSVAKLYLDATRDSGMKKNLTIRSSVIRM